MLSLWRTVTNAVAMEDCDERCRYGDDLQMKERMRGKDGME
jgi:hypothetical protein